MAGLEWHGRLADVFADRYGEPLYADAEWCQSLADMVEVAVQNDAGYEPGFDDSDEIVTRTADVIATISYGIEGAAKMRESARTRVRGGA